MKTNQKLIIAIVVTAIVAGGAGFFGGTKYQQSQMPSFNGQFGANGNFTRGSGAARFGQGESSGQQNFRPVQGEIISSDGKSITVKLDDGSTKIVLVGDSVTINKAEASSKSNLKTGEKVLVIGQTNSDGSVTADNIQLNPQGGFMFRGGEQNPTPANQ